MSDDIQNAKNCKLIYQSLDDLRTENLCKKKIINRTGVCAVCAHARRFRVLIITKSIKCNPHRDDRRRDHASYLSQGRIKKYYVICT